MYRENINHDQDDPLDLSRFTKEQDSVYWKALAELRRGRKTSHWMWFIFPQFKGLGFSDNSRLYAIYSVEEAKAYLDHPILGARLRECAEAVLTVEGRSAHQIMNDPDDLKLQSSMTLFAHVAEPDSVFVKVLDKYYGGKQDAKTLSLLSSER